MKKIEDSLLFLLFAQCEHMIKDFNSFLFFLFVKAKPAILETYDMLLLGLNRCIYFYQNNNQNDISIF